jgi:hypothetical protein
MKEKIAFILASLAGNPELASFGSEISIGEKHVPYDGISFFRKDSAAGEADLYGRVDFFFNTDDSKGRWMLFGLGSDGETLFVLADIDPDMAPFIVVPVICKFLTTRKLQKKHVLALLEQAVQFAEGNRDCYLDGVPLEASWREVRDAISNLPVMIALLYRAVRNEDLGPDSSLRKDINFLLYGLPSLAPSPRD